MRDKDTRSIIGQTVNAEMGLKEGMYMKFPMRSKHSLNDTLLLPWLLLFNISGVSSGLNSLCFN